MKTPLLLTLACLAARSSALGGITFVPFTNDADSGISADFAITSAASARENSQIGGIQFYPLELDETRQTAAANDLTLTATSGTLRPLKGAPVFAKGELSRLLSAPLENAGADDNSSVEIALDPGSLEPGKSYDFRLYFSPSGDGKRPISVSFAGDGQGLTQTGVFNEEDASATPGQFQNKRQPYYIDYQFVWDGKTAPGAIVEQQDGDRPFLFYAALNLESPTAPPARRAPAVGSLIRTDAPIAEAPDREVESDEFYQDPSLNDNGAWIKVGHYGTCWHPTKVETGWRPYTRGRWVYAEHDGWTWDSDEPYGWATSHYGRWVEVAGVGWVWVPGRRWAPAWVSWRTSDEYVGWAPLPPEAVGVVEFDDRVDVRYGLGPGSYIFARALDLGAPRIVEHIVPVAQNVTIIQHTTNVTNIVVQQNRTVYRGGPNITQINTRLGAGRGVPVVSLRKRAQAGAGGLNGNVLNVRAPAITTGRPARAPKIERTIATPEVQKGWGEVKDPAERKRLEAEMGRPKGPNAQPGQPEAATPGIPPVRRRPGVGEAVSNLAAPNGPGQVGKKPGRPGPAENPQAAGGFTPPTGGQHIRQGRGAQGAGNATAPKQPATIESPKTNVPAVGNPAATPPTSPIATPPKTGPGKKPGKGGFTPPGHETVPNAVEPKVEPGAAATPFPSPGKGKQGKHPKAPGAPLAPTAPEVAPKPGVVAPAEPATPVAPPTQVAPTAVPKKGPAAPKFEAQEAKPPVVQRPPVAPAKSKPQAPIAKPQPAVVKPQAQIAKPKPPVVKPPAPIEKPKAPVAKPQPKPQPAGNAAQAAEEAKKKKKQQ